MESAPIQIERIITEDNVEIMSVRWSPDDSILSIGCSDGSVKIYSDGGFLRSLAFQRHTESTPITCMRWKPATGKTRNVLLVTSSDGSICQYHASSGRIMYQTSLVDNEAYSCEYKQDASAYAIGCKDTSIKIYDENSKAMITMLGPSRGIGAGHNNRVFSLKWFDENLLASGGWDNKILIWDIREAKSVREIFGPHICGDSIDVKNNILLVGSYHHNSQLQLWDIAEGKNLYTESLKTGDKACFVYTAQFGKTENILAVGGSGSDESYFFNSDPVTPLGVIANLTKPVYSIDFCNESSRAAIGCGDGSVVIAKIQVSKN